MKSHSRYFLIASIVLTIASGCSTTSQLYPPGDKNRVTAGQLSDSTFKALKEYLQRTNNRKLNDTIIIKYDYNNETCWSLLDQSEDAHIMGFVTRHNERTQRVLHSRPNVSAFDFREPGHKVNKIKKWDNSIIIDSSGQLLNLLFNKRTTCGSSIIVMPDKRFIYLRSDSHSEVLDMTQKQIEEILHQ